MPMPAMWPDNTRPGVGPGGQDDLDFPVKMRFNDAKRGYTSRVRV